MYKDNELLFSGAAWSPTATGDNISTNVLDTGPLGLPTGSGGGSGTNGGRDMGIGGEMWLQILVTAAATSGGSATLAFALVTDSTATIVTKNILIQSPVIAYSNYTLGKRLTLKFPAVPTNDATPYKRYIAVDAIIATAVLTAGTFEAAAVKDLQTSDLYVSGFTLS